MRKSSISSPSAENPKRSARVGRWTGAVGIVISLAFLWWALHDVHLADVARRIAGAEPLWLALMIVTATLTFPLRTVRWRYLLRLEGATLPFPPLWHATAIGFMANNLLPARAGEFARAYAARRLTGARFTTAFASIAVERILDGITLVALLVLAALAGGFDARTTVGGATIGQLAGGGAVLFGGLLVVAIVVVRWPQAMLGLANRALHAVLPTRWADRLGGLIEGLVAGLDALGSPSRAATAFFWSFVVWSVNAASFWCAFQAFGLEVPWTAALMLQGLIAFGVAIPSAPGFFGVFEQVGRIGLALYGVAASPAVSLAIGYHLGTFLPITLLGLWSLWTANLRLGDLRGQEPR